MTIFWVPLKSVQWIVTYFAYDKHKHKQPWEKASLPFHFWQRAIKMSIVGRQVNKIQFITNLFFFFPSTTALNQSHYNFSYQLNHLYNSWQMDHSTNSSCFLSCFHYLSSFIYFSVPVSFPSGSRWGELIAAVIRRQRLGAPGWMASPSQDQQKHTLITHSI